MKKITIIEIVVVLIVLLALSLYLAPKFLNNKESKVNAQIKASSAIYTSKIIEEFSRNKNAVPSEVAKKVADELNATEKNPYDSKKPLFSISKDAEGCINIEPDDNLKMVIITTFDKKANLVARTVINPPSYVTYYKDSKKD